MTKETAFSQETTSEEVATKFAPQIKGKTVLVTGCTLGGLGAETAIISAKYGAEKVIVTGRRKEALDDTIAKIHEQVPSAKIIPVIFDLSSLKSVRQGAEQINSNPEIDHIDVVINNAAVMACPYGITEDGFETQFGSNHLGHFLFTNLIIDKVFASKGHPRIVNLSSIGHTFSPIRFDDIGFSNGEKYVSFQAYGQSKTANILFTRELNKKYNKSKGLVTFSVHPGTIGTNLARHVDFAKITITPELDYKGDVCFDAESIKTLFYKTVPQGAATSLVAAFDPTIESQSGSYLYDCTVDDSACKEFAKDMNNADRLWKLSEQLVGEKF